MLGMMGTSRTSLTEAVEALARHAGEPGFAAVSGELLAISAVLAREASLRGPLADPGAPADRRASLARAVLASRVSVPAVAVVEDAVRRRWSTPRDLVDAIEILGAEAAFVDAERAGRLDSVEDELFRFARTVEGDPALRSFLRDPGVDSATKSRVVNQLLAGRATDETVRLVRHMVEHPRGRHVEQAIEDLVELAAQRREELVAEVRVAAPVTADQERRLAAALGRIYGRTVTLQVSVDPDVLGGVVVRIGDEVIDGSLAHRLAEARRRLGG